MLRGNLQHSIFILKIRKLKINHLSIYLEQLEKEEQGIQKLNRWKEIKIGAEISKTEEINREKKNQ